MMIYWPDNEPRIHAMVISISKPFDCGRTVELKLAINNRSEVEGEITLRVPIVDSRHYRVGSVYAAHFKLMSEMGT